MCKVMSKIFFIFFFSVLLFGCKKDSDEYGPKITFTTPAENQVFNVNDDVHVTASVKDETKITSVSVSLLNSSYQLAHTVLPVTVSYSPSSLNIDVHYTLDNIHLLSGSYYMQIMASDGSHDSRAYQRILINEIPKVLKQVCVFTANSASQTNLSLLDTSFSAITPFHVFSGDYIGSSASSYYQQVSISGNYTGALTALKIPDNSSPFSFAASISSNPYYTGFYADEQNSYVSKYDGYIRGYDRSGVLIYNASANTGYYAQHLCFNSDYLIAEEKDKISGAKILVTYFQGGGGQNQTPLSLDIVSFCEKDGSNVFVFGNASGQGTIQLFDRVNNNLWDPYPGSLAAGAILSAVKLNSDTYLIAHSNGTIYKYQYTSSSVTTYLSGYTANHMIYDPDKNELYLIETNRITGIDYSSLAIHHSILSAENILDAHLLFNR